MNSNTVIHGRYFHHIDGIWAIIASSRLARVFICFALAIMFAFGYDTVWGFYYDGVDTGFLYYLYLGTDGSAGSATLIVSNIVLGWLLVLVSHVMPSVHGLSLYMLLLYFSSMAVIIHTWLFRLSWRNVFTKDWLIRNLFSRALTLFLVLSTHGMLCFTMLAGIALFAGCFLILINTQKATYRHLLVGGGLMLGGVFLRIQFSPVFFFFLFCFFAYSFWQNKSWRPQRMAWFAIILGATVLVSLVAHHLCGNNDERFPNALKNYSQVVQIFDYPRESASKSGYCVKFSA